MMKEGAKPLIPWRILLDLDGTVAQNAGRRLAAAHWQIELTEERYGSDALMEILGVTAEQFGEWWQENQEAIYDLATPLPGAADQVARLHAAGAHVAVVTARRQEAEAVTARWLERHGFIYDRLVFGADDKPAIARALELNLAFEDDPRNAVALAGMMPVVLVENFKNRSLAIQHPQVLRVSGWHEVEHVLSRLSPRIA